MATSKHSIRGIFASQSKKCDFCFARVSNSYLFETGTLSSKCPNGDRDPFAQAPFAWPRVEAFYVFAGCYT